MEGVPWLLLRDGHGFGSLHPRDRLGLTPNPPVLAQGTQRDSHSLLAQGLLQFPPGFQGAVTGREARTEIHSESQLHLGLNHSEDGIYTSPPLRAVHKASLGPSLTGGFCSGAAVRGVSWPTSEREPRSTLSKRNGTGGNGLQFLPCRHSPAAIKHVRLQALVIHPSSPAAPKSRASEELPVWVRLLLEPSQNCLAQSCHVPMACCAIQTPNLEMLENF